MAGFLRILLTLINAAVLLVGAYYIFFADDVSKSSSINECMRDRASSIQWTGAISSFVAAVGIVGACLKVKPLLAFYFAAVVSATAAAVVYTMFVSAMMPRAPSMLLYFSSAEHGYWLGAYGPIAQRVVANKNDFAATKQCFRYIDTCRIMANQTADQKLNYIDYGCCSPPNRCGLVQAPYSGVWVENREGLNSTDEECQMWAKTGKSCFDCDSCKAAYLAIYHERWELGTSSRVECIITLIGTVILSYYVFMHDHYRYLIGDHMTRMQPAVFMSSSRV